MPLLIVHVLVSRFSKLLSIIDEFFTKLVQDNFSSQLELSLVVGFFYLIHFFKFIFTWFQCQISNMGYQRDKNATTAAISTTKKKKQIQVFPCPLVSQWQNNASTSSNLEKTVTISRRKEKNKLSPVTCHHRIFYQA